MVHLKVRKFTPKEFHRIGSLLVLIVVKFNAFCKLAYSVHLGKEISSKGTR